MSRKRNRNNPNDRQNKSNNSNQQKQLTALDLMKRFIIDRNLIKIHNKLYAYRTMGYEEVTDDAHLGSIIFQWMQELLDNQNLSKEQFDKICRTSTIKEIARFIKLQFPLIDDFPSGEDEGYLAFENGILSTNSFNFFPYPNPEIRNTYHINTNYLANNDTPTPEADRFFSRITDNDPVLIQRIYEMIGYIIVPDTSARAFFLLQGVPHSGKSVLGQFIEGYFPKDRVTALDISRLGGQYLPDVMDESCLNLSMDLPRGILSPKSIANLKMLTGNDLMIKEVKYKDATAYRGQCKFLFSTNHPLRMQDVDDAFLERLIVIPFKHSVPKSEEDIFLLKKLNMERPAITKKALSYYWNFVARGRRFSGEGIYKPEVEYQLQANSTITEFVEKCCTLDSSGEEREYTQDLYLEYKSFCHRRGYVPVSSLAGFSQRLKSEFPDLISEKWRSGARNANGYRGIRLGKGNRRIKYDENGQIAAIFSGV